MKTDKRHTKYQGKNCARGHVQMRSTNSPIQKFVYIATSIGGRYCMMQLSFE